MKKLLYLFILLFLLSLLFVPIYDSVSYDYNNATEDMGTLFDKYKDSNVNSTVSLLSYRQTTDAFNWTIDSSTDDMLMGCTIPIWLISPSFLRDDKTYGQSSFLYRKVIIVTDKKMKNPNFTWGDEQITITFPKKIIVVYPASNHFRTKNVYRVYDLSIMGIVLLYIKVAVFTLIMTFIGRMIFRFIRRVWNKV